MKVKNTASKNQVKKVTKKVTKKATKVVVAKSVNIEDLDDEQLVARFSKGCSFSFEEIVKRYETKAHNLAIRLTRNKEDAEEVLQDVFITVYRKIDSFEGKSKFSSWLYRITVNAAFMKLRKRKQEQSISLEDIPSYAQYRNTELFHTLQSNKVEDTILNGQIKDSLDLAIGKLPDEYRAVFILRDVDGLSNKEVGEILDLTIPAVKSRLHRSRLMLRRKLKKFYQEYISETMAEKVA